MNIIKLTEQKIFEMLVSAVVNYENNQDLLKTVPHRRILDDMAVVPVIYDNERMQYEYVDSECQRKLDVSDDFLIDFAIGNSRRLYGISFLSLNDFLKMILKNRLGSECGFINLDELDDEYSCLFILTNSVNYFGASVLCFDNLMKSVSNVFKSDFFIIPSEQRFEYVTTHFAIEHTKVRNSEMEPLKLALLLLPTFFEDRCSMSLKDLIPLVNSSVLDNNQVLSDKLYLYRASDNQIVLA